MFDFIRRAWNAVTRPSEERASGLTLRDPALVELFGGRDTKSGAQVNERTALNLSVIHACVRVLAESTAMLPFHVLKKENHRARELYLKHPLAKLLRHAPNPEQSGYTFRETLGAHAALRGNALAYIQRDGAGRPIELWPIRPDRVLPMRVNGELVYMVFIPSVNSQGWSGDLDAWSFLQTFSPITLHSDVVFHLRGMSLDGVTGLSPVTLMREGIGLGMALEEHGARHFGNGSRPGGILTVPGKLSPEAKERLRHSWERVHLGLNNSQKTALLEDGVKWEKVSMSATDSQFLESKLFQVEDLARPFRVPLHMIGALKNASYASIEQQAIDFARYTLTPWCERWEAEIYRQLFTDSDREKYSVKLDLDHIQRGVIRERYTSYQMGRMGGWLSVNDIRRAEGLNEIGPDGDIYLQPTNMLPAGESLLPRQDAEIISDTGDGTSEVVAEAPDPEDPNPKPASASDAPKQQQ